MPCLAAEQLDVKIFHLRCPGRAAWRTTSLLRHRFYILAVVWTDPLFQPATTARIHFNRPTVQSGRNCGRNRQRKIAQHAQWGQGHSKWHGCRENRRANMLHPPRNLRETCRLSKAKTGAEVFLSHAASAMHRVPYLWIHIVCKPAH